MCHILCLKMLACKIGEIQITPTVSLYQSQLLGFDYILWLYHMLSLGKAGLTVHETSLYYFLTAPCKSTLSQNKTFSFKTITKKKNKISECTLSDFKTYCKTVFYGYKDRPLDQWNRIYSPEVNPCIYSHMIF